ncbi:MAG: hypothetical protein LW720_05785 [Pirellula sp.]|nr:hypothetical protein [Pirellula sp.]
MDKTIVLFFFVIPSVGFLGQAPLPLGYDFQLLSHQHPSFRCLFARPVDRSEQQPNRIASESLHLKDCGELGLKSP